MLYLLKTVFKKLMSCRRYPIFFGKTLLYRFWPGGFGYYGKLKRCKKEDYDFEKEKHSVRKKHNAQSGWQKDFAGDFRSRDYLDYNEYVTHQKQKFDEMLKIDGGFDNKTVFNYRLKFFSRFKKLDRYIKKDAAIICLGARQGTEVEVLRELGYKKAYGIDLNPGPDNQLVRYGDFMNMDLDNSSIDLIYSNCLDHTFEIEKFLQENTRVLKPNGFALYDFISADCGADGAFEAIAWKNDRYLLDLMLKYFKKIVRFESGNKWQWILLGGKIENHSRTETA